MTGGDVLLRLFSVLLLIAINAFFVTAEFSIVSVRRSRISQLVEAGDVQAKTVQSLQQSIDRLLSTTQLGITLSSLALGWIGQNTMGFLVATAIASLPLSETLVMAIANSVSVPIAFFLIVYLQIVLGELCPKSVALLYSEQLARFLGPLSLVIARLFNPFIAILNRSTQLLLKLVGIQYTGQGWYKQVTPKELQLIIATEKESTGLEAEERELLSNVFKFGDVLTLEVMVPRTSIIAIDRTANFQTLLNEVAIRGYSRYPVITESLDHIGGIIDFKDLVLPLANGDVKAETLIEPWIQPVEFVSESTLLSEVLQLMQRSHLKMVIVVDEFGGTAGLVTIQDLIDKILGDKIEANEQEITLQKIDEHTFLVPAQMNLSEVNQELNIDLPVTDEYQTLGGFLLYQLQKIPTQGETLQYENLNLTVVSTIGPRLSEISIHLQNNSNNE